MLSMQIILEGLFGLDFLEFGILESLFGLDFLEFGILESLFGLDFLERHMLTTFMSLYNHTCITHTCSHHLFPSPQVILEYNLFHTSLFALSVETVLFSYNSQIR